MTLPYSGVGYLDCGYKSISWGGIRLNRALGDKFLSFGVLIGMGNGFTKTTSSKFARTSIRFFV